MRPTVIFLGEGTFSESAFKSAAEIYDVPKIKDSDVLRLDSNDEIIPTLSRIPGAFACIGVETEARGRIRKTIDSFASQQPFNLTVLGCLRRKIQIGIHSHPDTHPSEFVGIMGHDQALIACKKSIKKLGITKVMPVGNNGIALSEITQNQEYRKWAALGPNDTAEELSLRTHNPNFGDAETFTSFLILHHGTEIPSVRSAENRCLIFFSLTDEPGQLVNFLGLLTEFNLLYIQGLKRNGLGYRFSIEIEVPKNKIGRFNNLRSQLLNTGSMVWILGPYERR